MKTPECPHKQTDCRFSFGAGVMTLMYSDVNGKPTSGGRNQITDSVKYNICGSKWISTQTELEDAQGKERTWSPSKY